MARRDYLRRRVRLPRWRCAWITVAALPALMLASCRHSADTHSAESSTPRPVLDLLTPDTRPMASVGTSTQTAPADEWTDAQVRALALATRDDFWLVRLQAIESLASLAPIDSHAQAAIAAAVDDPAPQVRDAAWRLLQKLGLPLPSPEARAMERKQLEAARSPGSVSPALGEPASAPSSPDQPTDWATTAAATTQPAPALAAALNPPEPAAAAPPATAPVEERPAGDAPPPDDPVWSARPDPKDVPAYQAAILKDAQATVDQKIAACDVLHGLGPAAATASRELVDALAVDALRDHAKAALKSIGPSAAEALLVGADMNSVKGFDAVAELLRSLDANDIQFLLPAIRDRLIHGSMAGERLSAVRQLGAIGPATGDVFSLLVTALHDRDSLTASQALWTLGQIRPDVDLTIPRILVQLGGASTPGHSVAAAALAKLPDSAWFPDTFNLAPALVAALSDPDPDLRSVCANMLKNAGERARPVIPALVDTIRSPEQERYDRNAVRAGRYLAASILVHLDATAQDAVPDIVKMMVDPQGAPPELPELMLLKMGPVAVSGLQMAIKSPEPKVRIASAGVMADLYPCEEATGRALADAMHDPDEAVRHAAAASLARCAPIPSAMSPVLAAAVQDKDPLIRDTAVEALAIHGFEIKDSPDVASLVAILSKDDNVLRLRAAAVLGRIGPPAADAIPMLTRMAGNQQSHIRRGAAEALAKIDPQGKRLGAALLATVESGDNESAMLLAPCVRHSMDAKLVLRLRDMSATDPDPAVRAAAVGAVAALGTH